MGAAAAASHPRIATLTKPKANGLRSSKREDCDCITLSARTYFERSCAWGVGDGSTGNEFSLANTSLPSGEIGRKDDIQGLVRSYEEVVGSLGQTSRSDPCGEPFNFFLIRLAELSRLYQ